MRKIFRKLNCIFQVILFNHVLFCFRGAKAAIIVYDITRAESFEKAKFWINEIRKQVEENIVIALAGNKVDLDNLR